MVGWFAGKGNVAPWMVGWLAGSESGSVILAGMSAAGGGSSAPEPSLESVVGASSLSPDASHGCRRATPAAASTTMAARPVERGTVMASMMRPSRQVCRWHRLHCPEEGRRRRGGPSGTWFSTAVVAENASPYRRLYSICGDRFARDTDRDSRQPRRLCSRSSRPFSARSLRAAALARISS